MQPLVQPLKDYYFLSLSLPELKLGEEPEISRHELHLLLHSNLRRRDFAQVETLLRYFDLCNIRSYWQGLPLGVIGNWDLQQIQTRLLDFEGLPNYLLDFLDQWPQVNDQVSHFKDLLRDYYQKESAEGGDFLRELLGFDLGIRLVISFLRAKEAQKDFAKETPPMDGYPLYESLVDQMEDEEMELPPPFDALPRLFHHFKEDPIQLDEALETFRFNWLGDKIDFDPFSLRHVLGYVVQYLIADRRARFQRERQDQLINQIVRDISDE